AEISEFLFEPCHPGCFPVGTLVETSRGPRPIETIEVGDLLLSFGPDGSRATARVSSIFKTENRLWRVVTEQGELVTTEAQPLYVDLSEARPVGELAPGDTLQIVREGHLLSTPVVAITP